MLTTVLLYRAMRHIWHWRLSLALPFAAFFIVVDFVFFAAILLKIRDGGWIPLALAIVLFVLMTTWRAAMDVLRRAQNRASERFDDFLRQIGRDKRPRVPGTAVFLTRLRRRVQPLILQHVRQIGAIPQTMVALTIQFVDRPRVRPDDQLELRHLGPSFWHLTSAMGISSFRMCPRLLRGHARNFRTRCHSTVRSTSPRATRSWQNAAPRIGGAFAGRYSL